MGFDKLEQVTTNLSQPSDVHQLPRPPPTRTATGGACKVLQGTMLSSTMHNFIGQQELSSRYHWSNVVTAVAAAV